MTVDDERRRIENSEKLSERDKELLGEYDEKLKTFMNNPGGAGHRNYLCWVRNAIEASGYELDDILVESENVALVGPVSEEQKRAAEAVANIKSDVKDAVDSKKTAESYMNGLQHFANRLRSAEWIRNNSQDHTDLFRVEVDDDNNAPDIEDVLFWREDIIPMIEVAYYLLCKVVVAFGWETGARPGSEITTPDYADELRLTVGDLRDVGEYIKVEIHEEAKTGTRIVKLSASAPLMRKWLNRHPYRDENGNLPDDAPLFTKPPTDGSKPDPLDLEGLRWIYEKLGERAGIDRPTNPEHFRKSRATVMGRKEGISREALRTWFGWKPGSDMPDKYYVADDEEEKTDEVLEAEGSDIEIERREPVQEIAPVECPRCGRDTVRFLDQCVFCDRAIDLDSEEIDPEDIPEEARDNPGEWIEDRQEARRSFVARITSGEYTAEDIKTIRDARELLGKFPELIDHADELVELTQELGDED